jgi:hypothetical protein
MERKARTGPTASTAGAPGGGWSEVYPWPDVAIHLHLLPSGKLLSFSDDDHDGSRDADFSKAFVIAIALGGAPSTTYVDVHNTTHEHVLQRAMRSCRMGACSSWAAMKDETGTDRQIPTSWTVPANGRATSGACRPGTR